MLCSQYGEITLTCVFLQELTPPLHPAPGTTRSDVTLARECQRLGGGKLFFGGMFDCSFPFFREWAIKSSAGLATSGESKLSFYMLSHWHTPLSIPTFGFCRAKNESYMKRFGKRWGGAGGEEKNHIKRRVERQKVFSSPPAINQSSFIT